MAPLKKFLCRWLGHYWQWDTISNHKAAHVCARCGLKIKIETAEQPPRTPDWWKAFQKPKSKPPDKPGGQRG
jgi:hypothetical protein